MPPGTIRQRLRVEEADDGLELALQLGTERGRRRIGW
jgi:hypothetical protein